MQGQRVLHYTAKAAERFHSTLLWKEPMFPGLDLIELFKEVGDESTTSEVTNEVSNTAA